MAAYRSVYSPIGSRPLLLLVRVHTVVQRLPRWARFGQQRVQVAGTRKRRASRRPLTPRHVAARGPAAATWNARWRTCRRPDPRRVGPGNPLNDGRAALEVNVAQRRCWTHYHLATG